MERPPSRKRNSAAMDATCAAEPSGTRRKLSMDNSSSSSTNTEVLHPSSNYIFSPQHTTVPAETPASSIDNDADDRSSVVSTSSSEPSSDSSDEDSIEESEHVDGRAEDIPTIRARGEKPVMRLGKVREGLAEYQDSSPTPEPSKLLERLKTFIPELAQANETLEAERKAGKAKDSVMEIDDGGGDEAAHELGGGENGYIEMNLGLGVLEEKHANSGSESETGQEGGEGGEAAEADVLGKLMGRPRKRKGEGIEVLGEDG